MSQSGFSRLRGHTRGMLGAGAIGCALFVVVSVGVGESIGAVLNILKVTLLVGFAASTLLLFLPVIGLFIRN